jgi:hypothetical protein
MDWIEQATGISLDGGNGSLEMAITLIVIALVCVLAVAVLRSSNLRLRG